MTEARRTPAPEILKASAIAAYGPDVASQIETLIVEVGGAIDLVLDEPVSPRSEQPDLRPEPDR